jgi:predicted RecA/RadA family phage recombinase
VAETDFVRSVPLWQQPKEFIMRTLFAAVVFIGSLAAATTAQAGDTVQSLLEPYFRIQTALTEDRTEGVKADAEVIGKQARALGEPGSQMAKAASELAAAADINAAREAFGRLSDAVIAYSEGTRVPTGDNVNTMYCPMNKKSWLQKGDQVKNPYYGKAMLTCGEKKKKST